MNPAADFTNKKLDTLFAILMIIVGVFLLFLSFFQILDISFPALILILILFASFYFFKKNKIIEQSIIITKPFLKNLNEIFFVILFILTIWTVYKISYPYPIYYYLLITMVGISIVISIFFTHEKNVRQDLIILFKIIVLGLIIRQGVFYAFPHIYGIDPIFHGRFADQIVYSQHIPITGEFYNYQFYPIYHLIVSMTKLTSSLSIRDSMFISIGTIQLIVTALFIYLIGKKVANQKIGLLASFIFCSLPYSMSSGIYLIPNMFGIVFFILLIYLLINYRYIRFSLAVFIMFLLIQISLILTHISPPLIFLVTLLLIYIVNRYYVRFLISNGKSMMRNTIFPGLCFIMLFATMYASYTIFVASSGVFSEVLRELVYVRKFVNVISMTHFIPFINIIYNNLYYYLIMGFSLFGVLAWLNFRRRTEWRLMIIALIVVLYSFMLFGEITSLIYLPYRMWIFIYVPVSILTAQGILYFSSTFRKKERKTFILIPTVLIALVFFLSVTSSYANLSDGFYSEGMGYRTALTQSELTSLNYLLNFTDGNFKSDSYYETYVKYKGYMGIYYNMTSIESKDTILLREYFLKNSYLRELSDFTNLKKEKISHSDYENIIGIIDWNVIYENGNVHVYKK